MRDEHGAELVDDLPCCEQHAKKQLNAPEDINSRPKWHDASCETEREKRKDLTTDRPSKSKRVNTNQVDTFVFVDVMSLSIVPSLAKLNCANELGAGD